METALEILSGPDALERVGNDWDRLWRETDPPAPMLEWAWVRRWWQVHGARVEPLVAVLREPSGKAAAIAPLYRRGALDRLSQGLRTFQIIGMGELEADEVSGEYHTWLGPAAARDTLSEKLAEHLSADRGWDRLRLTNLSPESMVAERLVDKLRPITASVDVQRFPSFVSPVMPHEPYIEKLPSQKLRYNLRRGIKEAAKQGVEFVRAQSLEEARRMFDELARLHQVQWEAKGKRGVFSGPVFRAFHDDMLAHYAATNRLWMVGLRKAGQFLVVRYLIESHGRLYDYISGVQDTDDNILSPGMVLHMFTLDAAVDAGLKLYDFMGGNYSYKRRLALEERTQVTIDAFRANLRLVAWMSARGVRRWLRIRRGAIGGAAPAVAWLTDLASEDFAQELVQGLGRLAA